jgi:hypothetical protein
MKTIVTSALLMASSCFGQTDGNLIATGDWSKPVRDENGVGSVLRGRLLVYDDQAQSAANHARIYLEIQQVFTNGWYDPVEIYCFGTNLVLELQNEHGQPIPSMATVRVGAVLNSYWVTVPCDGTVRIRADECTLGPHEKPDGLYILTGGNAWLVPRNATNDFYLTCSFTSATNHPSPLHYDTWRGTLRFPEVKIPSQNSIGLDFMKPQPNPQVGANGRQPFSSEANRPSAAAASRRSP